MNEGYIRLHWITILKLMRSYWLVLVSPMLRIVLQYVMTGNAEGVLISEWILFFTVMVYVVLKWFNTKIYIKTNSITVESGVFLKSSNKILVSRLTSVYIKRGLFDFAFNSSTCYLNVESSSMNIKVFKLNYRDLKNFVKVNGCDISALKTKANKKRFFLLPIASFCVFVTILAIKALIFGKFTYYDTIVIVILILVDLYYGYICCHNYLFGKIKIDNKICAYGTAGLSKINYCCPKDAIGIIKLYQTPADKRYKTCKIRLVECGVAAKGIKIANANVHQVTNSINSNFCLELQE